ncbi:zinc ribbon domain-containing protein, partial [Paracraurococcus lichenis]
NRRQSRVSGLAAVVHKAALAGVVCVAVDPRNTSRTCAECGCIDKRNRPDRDRFRCIACGYSAAADFVAARNIAARGAAVMQPDAGPETVPASSVL